MAYVHVDFLGISDREQMFYIMIHEIHTTHIEYRKW